MAPERVRVVVGNRLYFNIEKSSHKKFVIEAGLLLQHNREGGYTRPKKTLRRICMIIQTLYNFLAGALRQTVRTKGIGGVWARKEKKEWKIKYINPPINRTKGVWGGAINTFLK